MDLVYNKDFDLSPVDQVGFLDLNQVFVSGQISGDFNISDDQFNNASPDTLMHRPDDHFAAQRQRDYVRSSLAAQTQSETVTE